MARYPRLPAGSGSGWHPRLLTDDARLPLAEDKGDTAWQRVCLGLKACARWTHNITMYDYLRVPKHLKPGEYVLGFRWDCETSAQVWQSCADITITAPEKPVEEAA